MVEWTKVLIGGAALGAVAGLWRQIKSVLWKAISVFVQEVEIGDATVAAALAGHLMTRLKRVGPHTRALSAAIDYQFVEGQRRLGIIGYERFGGHSLLFRRGIWPLLFVPSTTSIQPEMHGSGLQKSTGSNQPTRVLFLRGTFDIALLTATAIREWNRVGWELAGQGADGRRRFFIKYVPDASRERASATASSWQYFQNIRLLDLSPHDVGPGSRDRSNMLDLLFFPDEVRDLIEELKDWRRSRDWYQARGIPWKRGWLLYGKPGTGKTALAGALAHDLGMPIFVFNLSELGNLDLMGEWRSMLASVPCIALIEDLDAVFHGRDNVGALGSSYASQKDLAGAGRAPPTPVQRGYRETSEADPIAGRRSGLLTFDVLLNCLDGVDRAEGVFTIVTTNHVEHIDPALGQPVPRPDGGFEFVSTRPGRIDRAIELKEMEPYVKKRMAKHILGDFPDECARMLRHIEEHPEEQETPARFQQRCSQIALECYWNRDRGRRASKASGAVAATAGRLRRV